MNKKAVLILVLVVLGVAVFFGHRAIRKSMLEMSAIPVVDQILENSIASTMEESKEMEGVKCSRVSIVEKTGNNTYTGVAILENDNILNVKIMDLGKDITVEIIE